LNKYSEQGNGGGGKEGKSWKRFQSYKGEAGLPKEAESLRVCLSFRELFLYKTDLLSADIR
jgi:nucleosome binding factor SPN SPT16 subunit